MEVAKTIAPPTLSCPWTGFALPGRRGLMALLALALLAPLSAQDMSASRAMTARDAAKRLKTTSAESLRVVEDGAVRRVRVADATPLGKQLLVLQPDRAGTIADGAKTLRTLPFKLQLVDVAKDEVREFRPVLQPACDVLEFDAAAKAYAVDVGVGIVDSSGVGRTSPLPQPLTLQLSTSLGSATPASLAIDHVGPPFRPVALRVAGEVKEVRLRVLWGAEAEDSVECTFPVHRAELEIEVNPLRIAGFGLEVADVVIRAPGAAGRGVQSVLVSHDRGRLEGSQQVALDGEGVGIVHLRSSGFGTARVRATAPTFEAAERELQFHWPVAFVLAAVLGGLVGGFVRYIRGPHSRRKATYALLRSAFIGIVVAAASAVGINVLGIQLGTGIGEAFVFVVAALGAMQGIKLVGKAAAGGDAQPAPAGGTG